MEEQEHNNKFDPYLEKFIVCVVLGVVFGMLLVVLR